MPIIKKEIFLATLIFVLSFLIRVISFPPSPNWDEVSHGYNAYSVLKTGKDEWGNFLPLIFKAFGDYKLPLYIYLTVIPIFLFGLNPFAVRFVSLLSGSLLPIILFLIIKILFPKKTFLPALGAFLTILSPWGISLSRIALEANLFLLFFTLSFYFLLKKKLSYSLIFYSLCLLTYNSSRILLPLYLIVVIYYSLQKKLKPNLFSIIILLFTIYVFIYQTLTPSGQARYKWVSILDSGAANQINNLRQYYPRLIVNKATYFIFTATKNYLSHFNPSFIFFKGGSHYQFNIPSHPLVSYLFLPFFLIGFFIFIKKYPLLFYWLLLAPLPSAITRDAPHTIRSVTLFPVIVVIIILGVSFFQKSKYLYLVYPYIVLSLIVSSANFYLKYKQYIIDYSQSWQYGYKEAISFVKDQYPDYKKIVFTKKYGEPHEFVLFYWPWDPQKYQSDSKKIWDYHADWYWIDAFDKFKFVNDWEIKNKSFPPNTLLITSPNNYPTPNAQLLQSINFLDNSKAFDIVSYD